MNITVETITPEIAADYLELNTNNRNLRKAHVLMLAKEMNEGRWVENGDPIRFNGKSLIDGQHRLKAIISSRTNQRMVVVRGLSGDAMNTIDTNNAARTAGDALSLSGHSQSNILAAALAVYDQYNKTGNMWRRGKFSTTRAFEVLEEIPRIKDTIKTWSTTVTKSKLCPTSVAMACVFIFEEKDKELADEYITKVFKGMNLSDGEPAAVVRKALLNTVIQGVRVQPHIHAAFLIQGWNALRSGREIKRVRKLSSASDFPIIK